jgi:RNA polymerase sigma-70 factor (ECF subfamily)
MRYVRRQEAAEDAVQDIFLRAFDALDRFHIERRFYSWLYTIAVNHLKNIKDKRTRRGSDSTLSYEDRVATGDVTTPLADPERELERSESEAMLHRAIESLSPKYRDVIILRQLQELSVAEVSEILQLPEGTVKTNLRRARQALASAISNETFFE